MSRSMQIIMAGLMACEWHLSEAFSQLVVSVVPKRSFILIASMIVQLDLVNEIMEVYVTNKRICLWVDEHDQPRS